MKKVYLRAAAALLTAALFCPVKTHAISAEHYVLMDAITGGVLKEKRADEESLIASTTKIMTALLICEQCNVLDQMRIPKEAVGIEGSSMYLQEGEILSLQELLYGLMLSSGNDAAVALALYCSGSIEAFAERMNDKARALGLQDSHFQNPNGLDAEGHYSTAKDMALLSAYAMENPIFAKTVSTKTVTIGNRFLRNHNKLLWLYPDSDGVKTGYTKAAGRILVSSAEREGRRLVAVTFNAPDDWNDHRILLESGFSEFRMNRIVTAGDIIGYRELVGGQKSKVAVLAAENYVYSMRPEDRPMLLLSGKGFVYAPVAEGTDAGYAYILMNGKAVDKIPVVYGETIEMNESRNKNCKLWFWS